MGLVIIYPTDDGIAMLTPMQCSIPLSEIALRDVPEGKPFVYVNSEDLPDLTFREAFTHDFKQPDGVGLGYENYMKLLENREKQSKDFDLKLERMKQLEEQAAKSHAPEPPKPARSRRKKTNADE
jgi:hypothetical protein